MKLKILVASLFAVGMVASPLANATNGYFSHGYGMKAKGMAGVGIALPVDSLAAATNPAGMVMVGDRIDVGLDWFKPSRSSEINGNAFGTDASYDANATSNFLIPEFGYNKMVSSTTAFGVSVYGNGGMNTDYEQNPFARFGATGSAGVNLSQLFIAPTWSMKVNPKNAVGISLLFAYQAFEAKGIQPFAGMSSNPSAVSNNGTDSSTGYAVKLGWTGEVSSSVTLGATYQSKSKMGKFSKYSGLFAEQGGFDIPASYGVGIAMKLMPETTIALDVQQIQYSGVAAIANTASQGGPLGANNGAGFGWQDMTVFKLGVSHAVNSTLKLRAGYSHNNQQIPNDQTLFNILAPGVVQDHLTLGATFVRPDKSEITVGYMHAFRKTVSGSGSIPPGFGGGEANLTMSQDSLGVAYSW